MQQAGCIWLSKLIHKTNTLSNFYRISTLSLRKESINHHVTSWQYVFPLPWKNYPNQSYCEGISCSQSFQGDPTDLLSDIG